MTKHELQKLMAYRLGQATVWVPAVAICAAVFVWWLAL